MASFKNEEKRGSTRSVIRAIQAEKDEWVLSIRDQ